MMGATEMEAFLKLKRAIRERGTAAVAKEMRRRGRVQFFREAARRTDLDFSLITDAEIVDWLGTADALIREGILPSEEAMEMVATAAQATQRAREGKGGE